jgi:hypothetical protein
VFIVCIATIIMTIEAFLLGTRFFPPSKELNRFLTLTFLSNFIRLHGLWNYHIYMHVVATTTYISKYFLEVPAVPCPTTSVFSHESEARRSETEKHSRYKRYTMYSLKQTFLEQYCPPFLRIPVCKGPISFSLRSGS